MNNTYSAHVANQNTTHVEVLFYQPKHGVRNKGDCINALAVWWDGPFCHTELKFPNEKTVRIVKQGRVELVHRGFDGKFYSGLKIQTTYEKAQKALDIATELCQRQVSFGLTTHSGSQTNRTYCSKLVRDLLVEAEIISGDRYYESCYLSPSALYRALMYDPKIKVSVFTPELTTPCVSFLNFSNNYEQLLN